MSRRPAALLLATATLLSLTLAAHAAPPIRPPKPLTPGQLDQLAGPIALYPDPLLKQILTASTHTLDLALATQWLRDNPTPTDDLIAAQPWDQSILTLIHYPAAFHLLADNLAWTQTLARAYTTQSNDLNSAIQRLRVKARITGTLNNSPEQTVIVENHYIEIQPADPDVIYVPIYDPSTCYTYRRPPHFEHPSSPPPPPTTPSVPSTPPTPAAQGISPPPAPQRITSERPDGFQHAENTTPEPTPAPSTPAPTAALAPAPAPAPQPAPSETPAPQPHQSSANDGPFGGAPSHR